GRLCVERAGLEHRKQRGSLEDLGLVGEARDDPEQCPAAIARRRGGRPGRLDARQALLGDALGFGVADDVGVDCLHPEPPVQRRPVRSDLVEKILAKAPRKRDGVSDPGTAGSPMLTPAVRVAAMETSRYFSWKRLAREVLGG